MLTTYEIHTTNGIILADNLTFDDLPIIFQAYQEWYGRGSVIACYRQDSAKPKPTNRRDEFYQQWYELMDNLIALDNI